MMLHNESRKLAVEAYERTHDAERIADDFGVSTRTVYSLEEKKRKTHSFLHKSEGITGII